VVIGAGDRGRNAYAPLLLARPELGLIVAVAEPDEERRRAFAARFGLSADACFASDRELLEHSRLADFAIVATPDAYHLEPATAALERGYSVLLEKPMASNEADCERLAGVAERTGSLLQICHVLRYAPLYRTLKQAIDAGEIGEIVTIQHSENVSYWHYAHSYCRGNWRNRAASSPMILAKSCHDLDILYWLAGAEPLRLTSLERPTWLCEANAPEGAPEYCIEGCRHAESCPYDAVAMYRDLSPLLIDLQMKTTLQSSASAEHEARSEVPRARGWRSWPISVITRDPTPAGVDRALRTSRYGRCAYRVGDNDQPASQSVDVLFANGVNASFTMHSTSFREGRETRIDGTRGSIVAGLYTLEQFLRVHDHKTGLARVVDLPAIEGNHGGADPLLFEAFLAAARGEARPITTAAESLWSHRMAFAADRAAREGCVVSWKQSSR
jgi:predicted dehydrogenase